MTPSASSPLSADTLASLAALGRRVGRPLPAVSNSPVREQPSGGIGGGEQPAGWLSLPDQALAPGLTGLVPRSRSSRLSVCPDAYEERAAILEHEGGLPRAEAERMALSLLLLDQMDSPNTQVGNLDRELAALDARRR